VVAFFAEWWMGLTSSTGQIFKKEEKHISQRGVLSSEKFGMFGSIGLFSKLN
jgi:hypothetical protein